MGRGRRFKEAVDGSTVFSLGGTRPQLSPIDLPSAPVRGRNFLEERRAQYIYREVLLCSGSCLESAPVQSCIETPLLVLVTLKKGPTVQEPGVHYTYDANLICLQTSYSQTSRPKSIQVSNFFPSYLSLVFLSSFLLAPVHKPLN